MPRDAHENIARKKWDVDFLSAILPSANAAVKGQRTADLTIAKHFGNFVFVPSVGI
jgi:hypothetical protein